MSAVEAAVADYREHLLAEADLAACDLAELEDHLRTLIADLCAEGLAIGDAIAEARRRLGDPAIVAREHARVRTPFGLRISRLRAWSAALLVVPLVLASAVDLVGNHVREAWFGDGASRLVGSATPLNWWADHPALDLAIGLLLLYALVRRRPWARGIALGSLSFVALQHVICWTLESNDWAGRIPFWLVTTLGGLALLAPWRRGELTAASAALACQVFAYKAAVHVVSLSAMMASGDPETLAPASQVALIAAAFGIGGAILRSRWSGVCGLVAAVALVVTTVELAEHGYDPLWLQHHLVEAFSIWSVMAGAVLAATGAWLVVRTSRRPFGDLERLRPGGPRVA